MCLLILTSPKKFAFGKHLFPQIRQKYFICVNYISRTKKKYSKIKQNVFLAQQNKDHFSLSCKNYITDERS